MIFSELTAHSVKAWLRALSCGQRPRLEPHLPHQLINPRIHIVEYQLAFFFRLDSFLQI